MRASTFSLALALTASTLTPARAQQPIASVSTHDALVTGGLAVSGDHATLLNRASITAYDHTATLALARGGEVQVCATSQLHLYHAGPSKSLLFGLDRGALEIQSPSEPEDIVLTPDIRFSIEHAGLLDLRLRVTRSGDTCVDNHGAHAPVLFLNASFTGASYRLLPGQHVLFEHGDLHQVVDHERSSCGCPPSPPAPSAAELARMTSAERAAAEHPFPAAASEGLTTNANPLPPPETNPPADATTDFRINAGDTTALALTTTPAGSPLQPQSPTSLQPHRGFFGSIGHFFYHLFHPHPTQQ